MLKPVADNVGGTKTPLAGVTTAKDEWSFSFKYFNQIENFGADCIPPLEIKWFISVLERLKDLSAIKTAELENVAIRNNFRYHPVNWQAYHIPIAKSELNWIPREILENDEIEFWQFHVSKALGRVVGFWYERLNARLGHNKGASEA